MGQMNEKQYGDGNFIDDLLVRSLSWAPKPYSQITSPLKCPINISNSICPKLILPYCMTNLQKHKSTFFFYLFFNKIKEWLSPTCYLKGSSSQHPSQVVNSRILEYFYNEKALITRTFFIMMSWNFLSCTFPQCY